MATEIINLDELNALRQKADSGLGVSNTRLISEEYNILLDAVKRIGAAVQDIQEGGATGDKIIISTSAVNGRVEPNASVVDKYSTVVLEAFANEGYYFTKWSDGITSNPRTVVALESTTYTAEFAAAAVGDVAVTMTTDGVIKNMTADNADKILYDLNGGVPSTDYTGGEITLQGNNKLVAIAHNTATGATGVIPVVNVEYNADITDGVNALAITSNYDMTCDGESKGKSFTLSLVVGTHTIVANGRTSTITIEE